jgi:hypothetical protein
MKNINPFKLGLCIVVKKKSLDKILNLVSDGLISKKSSSMKRFAK